MFGFLKKANRDECRVRYVARDVSRLTVSEWRSNPDYCETARKVLSSQELLLMLDTVRNEIMSFHLPENATLEQRALRQAEAQGFQLAFMMLYSLGKHEKTGELPEATFEPQELDTE